MNVCALSALVAVGASCDIAAIVVGAKFQTVCSAICAYWGISFNAATYLLAGGSVGVSLLCLLAPSVAANFSQITGILYGLFGLFSILWALVGAVLLRAVSETQCSDQCGAVYVMAIVYVLLLLMRGIATCVHTSDRRQRLRQPQLPSVY